MRHDSALEVGGIQGLQPQLQFLISDASVVGEARRAAQRLAQEARLDETSTGRVGIVVTELGNNLVRHAGGGELFIQLVGASDGSHQMEVISMDSGPGMADMEKCLQDGYSTGGTAGTGLGAVRRLSSLFDAYSPDEGGCVVVARIGAGPPLPFGAICSAVRGERVSGDGWRLATDPARHSAIMIDGLGHGESAAEAAAAGVAAFAESPFDSPDAILDRVHRRLHGTRGAAAACVQRSADGKLRFAGIGNISARALGAAGSQGLTSHNGILGLQVRRMQQFEYDCSPHPLLILHTDGVSSRWDIGQYDGLRVRHPALIAAVLYREHRRERDDATILVVRHG